MFVNECKLSGKVVRDAERGGAGPYRWTLVRGGNARKDKPGEVWPIQFFDCQAWENAVPEAANLKAGQFVTCSGRLHMESWEDKTTGAKRSKVVIVVSEIITEAGEVKPKFAPAFSGDAPAQKVPANLHGVAVTDEDIPF